MAGEWVKIAINMASNMQVPPPPPPRPLCAIIHSGRPESEPQMSTPEAGSCPQIIVRLDRRVVDYGGGDGSVRRQSHLSRCHSRHLVEDAGAFVVAMASIGRNLWGRCRGS